MLMLLWIVAGLWAWFWLAVAARIDDSALTALTIVAIGFAPFFPLALIAWLKDQKGQTLRDAALALAPAAPGGKVFQHEEAGTGIALNCAVPKLTVWAGGYAQCYAYDDVRSWEYVHEQSAMVNSYTFGQAIQAKRQAARATGFCVEVRDIDMPKWRVVMTSHPTQLRWMEIFRQEIKEGGSLGGRALEPA